MFLVRFFFRISFVVVLFSSCRMQMEPLTIGKAEKLKLTKISLQGIEGEISLKITNPNKVGFTVYPSYVEAFFSGIRLGKAETRSSVFVPASSDKEHTFYIKGNFKDIKLNDFTRLVGGKLGELEVKGKLRAGKWFIRRSFDVSHTQRISFGD